MSTPIDHEGNALLSTIDAAKWADLFCARFRVEREVPDQPVQASLADQWGLMVSWFASAIETGRSAGRREALHVPLVITTTTTRPTS